MWSKQFRLAAYFFFVCLLLFFFFIIECWCWTMMLVMSVAAAFFSFQIIYERIHRLVRHNPLKLWTTQNAWRKKRRNLANSKRRTIQPVFIWSEHRAWQTKWMGNRLWLNLTFIMRCGSDKRFTRIVAYNVEINPKRNESKKTKAIDLMCCYLLLGWTSKYFHQIYHC